MPETEQFIWCIVANTAEDTKHFPLGTKVYCYPPMWGDGYERVQVVGKHRGSDRIVTMILPSKQLTNWRVKAVYSPQIISKMAEWWDDSGDSKAKAESLVGSMLAAKV